MSIGKLGQLIESLSKNEKAYFKRWLPNTNKENRYVLVFDKIDKQPDISLKELSEKLGSDFSAKQLKNVNSHLWSSLLLSLRDYHRNNDIQLSFHARSDGIKVLRSKGQFVEALKATKKLLADCVEIEMYPEALRAIEHIENIRSIQNPVEKGDPNEWRDLYIQKEKICLSMAESCRIRSIERELKSVNDKLGDSISFQKYKTLLAQLKNRLDQISLSEQSSFDARFRYYSVQATISSVQKDHENIGNWFGKLVVLLDENPVITNQYFKAFYIIVLHNYIQSLFVLRKMALIPKLLQQMNERQGEIPELAARDYFLFGTNALTFYNLTENFQRGFEEWTKLSNEQPDSNDPSLEQDVIKFTLQGAVVCFWNRDYKRALSVLRPMLRHTHSSDDSSDLITARILEILCNFELNDFEHTEHLATSFQRKLQENNSTIEAESVLVKAVLNQLKKKKEPAYAWENLAQKIETMGDHSDYVYDLMSFDMFKYVRGKASDW